MVTDNYITTFTYDPINHLWRAWSGNPFHIEKFVGGQWELNGVDAEGVSFSAPEDALRIFPTNGKKLPSNERRKREADLYRAQIHQILKVRCRDERK